MGLFSKDDGDKGRCHSPRRDRAGHTERSHGGLSRTERDQPRRQRRLEGTEMLDNGDHHMPRSWP